MKVLCIPALLLVTSLQAGMWFDSWALRWLAAAISIALVSVIARGLLRRYRQRKPVLEGNERAFWLRLLGFSGIILVTGALSAAIGMCYLRAWSLVHPGRVAADRGPEAAGIQDYQAISFVSDDGITLRGWYLPSRNGGAAVFVHGQGTNRTALLKEAAQANQSGYGALLFDLRNQGESGGTVTTLGLREAEDVIAAVRYTQAQAGVDPNRVALVGQSMGGAAAMLATKKLPELRGLVVECSFTSLEDNIASGVRSMGLPAFPFAQMVAYFGERDAGIKIAQVRPIDALASFNQPLLIIHGGQDDTLPVKNAYALYAAAREPKSLYIIPEARHCDFETAAGPAYEKRLVVFLQSVLK